MKGASAEWGELVRRGRLDDAYEVFLSRDRFYAISKKIPMRRLSICAASPLLVGIKRESTEIDFSDDAVDLSREFLIFWKAPDIVGRFLLSKIVSYQLRENKFPGRALCWFAHWLVFQGEYKKAGVIFRLLLKKCPRGSRLHGEILSMIGNYFHSRRKLKCALHFHMRAERILASNGDKFFQMFNIGTSAKTYAELGDLKDFNGNILVRYDHLNPIEPDERYGMRVLVYGAYLHLLAGNIDLAKQFYLSAEKCYKRSGSPLDSSIYCIFKSVILFFFRDLSEARTAISNARALLSEYGQYKSYEEMIDAIEEYFTTGNATHPILENLLFNESVVSRSEIEAWYRDFFSLILPLLEKFHEADLDQALAPLREVTSATAQLSCLKDNIQFEDIEKARFQIEDSDSGKTAFVMDLFHKDKVFEVRLESSYKKWRNPEIIEAIRHTLVLIQNISREEHLKKLTYGQAQKIKEGEIARRIAHDIKSPLATLQLILRDQKSNGADYELMKTSTQRIEDIANSLSIRWDYNANKRVKLLAGPFLESLIFAKRYEYKGREISLDLKFLGDSFARYIYVNELEMSRTISNIINNAVEASDRDGLVEVLVEAQGASLNIKIRDYGCGIEEGHLEVIFEKDVSFKDGGSGLGLYYARKFLQESGGSITAESILKKGTVMSLTIQTCPPPSWIQTTLFLDSFDSIVIVDDYGPNVEMIKRKVLQSCEDKNVSTFSNLQSFHLFMKESDTENTFFVIDYDLMGENESGIDLIMKYNLSSRSVLATHHYENEEVISACEKNRIKIVPKVVFENIRIMNEKVNVFIADDEAYFLQAIKSRLKHKFNVFTFSDPDLLLENAKSVSGPVFFFIDKNFGKEDRGDGLLSSLATNGWKDLYNISEDKNFIHNEAVKMRKKEICHFLN